MALRNHSTGPPSSVTGLILSFLPAYKFFHSDSLSCLDPVDPFFSPADFLFSSSVEIHDSLSLLSRDSVSRPESDSNTSILRIHTFVFCEGPPLLKFHLFINPSLSSTQPPLNTVQF